MQVKIFSLEWSGEDDSIAAMLMKGGCCFCDCPDSISLRYSGGLIAIIAAIILTVYLIRKHNRAFVKVFPARPYPTLPGAPIQPVSVEFPLVRPATTLVLGLNANQTQDGNSGETASPQFYIEPSGGQVATYEEWLDLERRLRESRL